MNIFEELENQYFEIDNDYSSKEFRAHARGHLRKEAYWKRKRELNTHAYFLFLFTRLEQQIKTHSTTLINKKKLKIQHWKYRSIWEIPDVDNLHFKKRMSLLTQKGQLDFNTIANYYETRNTIAHGGSVLGIQLAINMIDVFNNMKRYYKELKR